MSLFRATRWLALGFAVACNKQSAESTPHMAEASSPRADTPPVVTPASALVASSSVAPRPAAVDAGAGPAPQPPAEDPPVRVKLVTIGMHVGGGPYDEITKEPMKRSVEPRFPELARCWKHVEKGDKAATRQGDVGVDLVIEASGGRAKVSNPRTTLPGEAFVSCVVAFFESVEFLKPKNGKTVVSYSVRFLP